MKILLPILFLSVICTFHCFSQSNATSIYINKIPEEGILLDKGWKFIKGDNPDYAKPGYDDSKWQSIDPTKDIQTLLPQIGSAAICWFRIKLTLDSSLLKDALALLIAQTGASEIYVNGKLFKQFGITSSNAASVKPYDPWEKPIPLPLEDATILLAVRYAPEPDKKFLNSIDAGYPTLGIRIGTMEKSMDQYTRESARQMNSTVFRIGLFLLLAILHFAFYLFHPSQKANLFLFLFAICVLTNEFVEVNLVIGVNSINDLHKFDYYARLLNILLVIANFLLLNAFYTLFSEKKSWIYWVLIFSFIINIFTYISLPWTWQQAFIFNSMTYAELIRIAFKSNKNKIRGAGIITVGAIIYLVFWIVFILGVPLEYMAKHLTTTYTVGDLTYNLMSISIPVSISIYLALDFGYTSKALKQQLDEVEKLSAEKHQILAAQNETLEEQVAQRTIQLKHSLEELRATQKQLIQSEKMASLGELTAGIAHEIQNPLNFVNNFSDINKELLEELQEEAGKGNIDEVKIIATDIIANEEKINHHGKRADAIVKGMLQHSRTNTGVKEATDINTLCNEYVKLAFNGLRAKDKDFNSDIKTAFDESIGKINIVPQDIGRVLLNVINNAFYAVNEKKKTANENYQPTVSVTTKKINDKIEISVADNGNGIPASIKEKIFQPFFTTKPTGQGTGLGLSLSYDIIKAHGGEITVSSQEGEGTAFIIVLPA